MMIEKAKKLAQEAIDYKGDNWYYVIKGICENILAELEMPVEACDIIVAGKETIRNQAKRIKELEKELSAYDRWHKIWLRATNPEPAEETPENWERIHQEHRKVIMGKP